MSLGSYSSGLMELQPVPTVPYLSWEPTLSSAAQGSAYQGDFREQMFVNCAFHVLVLGSLFLDFRRGLESHSLIHLLYNSVHGDLISYENCSALRINRIQNMGVQALYLQVVYYNLQSQHWGGGFFWVLF